MKVFEHLSDSLTVLGFIVEVQLDGKVLLRLLGQPAEPKLWEEHLRNVYHQLRTCKSLLDTKDESFLYGSLKMSKTVFFKQLPYCLLAHVKIKLIYLFVYVWN